MPRVSRNYQRKDFTKLLNELNSENKESANLNSSDSENKVKINVISKSAEVVGMARRKRSSKMDNPKMKYIYSTKTLLQHDRDCPIAAKIKDEYFEMSENFQIDKRNCTFCNRSSLIRNGIKDGSKRIDTYNNFFKRIGATNKDLYKLFIENKAIVKWENNNTVKLYVGEDNWKVLCDLENGHRLYHNNYICLHDYSRHFDGGFHEQIVLGSRNFHNILNVILSYSWEEHVEKIKAEKECSKMNLIYNIPISKLDIIKNCKLNLINNNIELTFEYLKENDESIYISGLKFKNVISHTYITSDFVGNIGDMRSGLFLLEDSKVLKKLEDVNKNYFLEKNISHFRFFIEGIGFYEIIAEGLDFEV